MSNMSQVDLARHAEEKRLEDVKRAFRVLHRWTDSSWGAGFDVVVFPDCVMQLDAADPSASKILVFPATKTVKFRVMYTAKIPVPALDSMQPGSSSPLRSAQEPSLEFLSELRICARDCSNSDGGDGGRNSAQENPFLRSSAADIVLRWKDGNHKASGKTLLNSPHYSFIKILYDAHGKCMISQFKSGPATSNPQSDVVAGAANPNIALHPGVFLDAEEEEGPVVLRTSTQDTLFAEKAAKTFDSSCFESRKSCLRQIMKCFVAAAKAKDPSQTVESVHRLKGASVLEIVQRAHSTFESVCQSRQIDFSKLDNFENDSAMLMQDLLHTAADVIEATVDEESALYLRGVDLFPDSCGIGCSDELLVQMKDWYDHQTPRATRPQGFSGVPEIRSAEVMFIRQIQKLMFDVYVEHISLGFMSTGLQEAFDEIKASCEGNYCASKIIGRLLASSYNDPTQSKIKCMVGKYKVGDSSELECKAIAKKVADLALSPKFKQRVENLRACLQPQLFACHCRLMVDDLMSVLPAPTCAEDAYGADHLANFHELLWYCVLVPLLMTDENNCVHLFVRLFVAHEYGNSAGEIDTTEKRIRDVINNGTQSNLFFIKGQNSRGCDADDHSLMVLSMCLTTMKNFYEPLKKVVARKLAARELSRSKVCYNLQEVFQLTVNVKGAGTDWFFGSSKEKLKKMAPTHARFTTPSVPFGMFTEELSESTFEIPIQSLDGAGRKYSNLGSQFSLYFPSPGREVPITVELIKKRQPGDIENSGFRLTLPKRILEDSHAVEERRSTLMQNEGSDEEILATLIFQQWQHQSSHILSSTCATMQYQVVLNLKNWLCHEFPSQNSANPEKACWYWQDDNRYAFHACNRATVDELDRQFAKNEHLSMDFHRFEMPIPIPQLSHQHWLFEAISTNPTYVMKQINKETSSKRIIVRLPFQSMYKKSSAGGV